MDVNTNALSADPWTSRAEDLVAMNARGPGCFDFRFYTEVGQGGLRGQHPEAEGRGVLRMLRFRAELPPPVCRNPTLVCDASW